MIKNWLVRGDTHGNFDWLNNGTMSEYNPDETAVIILGDAGFNYFMSKSDNKIKQKANESGFLFYCVRGNHEARPSDVPGIKLFHDSEVGGLVWIENHYSNIRYFMDWGEYWINGYHVAVIGGAYSVDKWWRLNRVGIMDEKDNNPQLTGWFSNEQLTTDEKQKAMEELGNESYDFVFTHTCPMSWRPTDLFLGAVDQKTVDTSMEQFLEEFRSSIHFYVWCFGHYHADRIERPYVEQYYNDIEELDSIWARWENYNKTGELDWWLNKSPYFWMR